MPPPPRPRPEIAYDAFVFDLDGTVYLGDRLLPNAGETITALRAAGKRTVFLSNNPTHTARDYADRLTRLGLPTPVEDVVNSSVVMAHFLRGLRASEGIERLFVVGEPPLHDVLAAEGFELLDAAPGTQAVIASFDRTFAYWKLQVAFDAIRAGARLFATNADRYCPVPGGGEPDAASVIAAIEACTGVACEAVVGKPSTWMSDAVLARLGGIEPARCLVVGDRIETDVALGRAAGMGAGLVLTGATSEAALAASTLRPDHVLRDLGDLLAPASVG